MRRTSTDNEQDLRLKLFNSLLTTPHRDLAGIYPIHQEIIKQDPRFYVHLAAWYSDEGEIRDHKEMFIVNLVLSGFPGHRDTGLALLRELPPYQVGRVFDFIKGRVTKRNIKQGETSETVSVKQGLFRNIPRSMKTEIKRYLREREAKPEWFDAAVLQARRPIKRMYASLRLAPSERAQSILFDEQPPSDSRIFALKLIAQAKTPAEQARMIVDNQIPYRVAASVITRMTPTVLVALIERMSSQELINNISSLKRRGAFEHPDVKMLLQDKLEKAKSDKNVSAYKAKVAADAADASGELADQLEAVTETQVKKTGRIKRPTALLIDKSGSMDMAIEVGRQLGAMISAICETDLFTYAFDTIAYPIEPGGASLADWEKALLGINAGGATSCGVALEWMALKGERAEQIVIITDEGENSTPRFIDAYQSYAETLNVKPDVIIIKIGTAIDILEKDCGRIGVVTTAFEFKGDYYSLPNVIPLLTRPSMLELMMEVLNYPLPKRKER
ncbi:hypothetical protein QUF90_02450 [Desulfococcaceae bacterium HSG9]|nr:hypothetical protein [Desulfococcaceae bacterium HSG9]